MGSSPWANLGDQGSLPAWTSADGGTWTALPVGTLGSASSVEGAPCGAGVIVATQAADATTTVWHSTDGATWTSSSAPDLLFGGDNLAGNQLGAVAIVAPGSVAFTTDGLTWSTVPLPGGPNAKVTGVAVSNGRFVAVGNDGAATISPVAWSSEDGLHWTRATVPSHRNDGFRSIAGAGGGLVAITRGPRSRA